MQVLNVEPGSPAELAGLRPTLQSQQGILLAMRFWRWMGRTGGWGMGTFLNKNWPEKPIVWGILMRYDSLIGSFRSSFIFLGLVLEYGPNGPNSPNGWHFQLGGESSDDIAALVDDKGIGETVEA